MRACLQIFYKDNDKHLNKSELLNMVMRFRLAKTEAEAEKKVKAKLNKFDVDSKYNTFRAPRFDWGCAERKNGQHM